MGILRITLLFLCCVMVQPAYGKIYQWVDKNGNKQFTSYPPPAESTYEQGSTTSSGSTAPNYFTYSSIPPEYNTSNGIYLHTRRMLEQRRYDELNSKLHRYQMFSEMEPLAENILFDSYSAFGKNDPTYEGLLTDWIKANPKTYQPYLARAAYYYKAGWNTRGEKWARETTQKQFEGMGNYFEKARIDLNTVLNLYDRTVVPYYFLIGMANAQGRDIEAEQSLRKALSISPESYKVRATYINGLKPRWGGSYEIMESFANDSLSYAQKSPKLYLLHGHIYDDQGLVQESAKKFNVAEQIYTKALSFGENYVIYFHRGRARSRNGQYEDALADLNHAIELCKDEGDYYYWRAWTYSKINQYEKAANDISHAESLEGNTKYYNDLRKVIAYQLAMKADESEKQGQPSDSLAQYDSAIALDPDNAFMRYNKAITLYNKDQLDEALEELKRAVELDPHEINFYIAIDAVLARSRKWDQIIGYWDDYILNHPENSRAYMERAGTYHHKGDETAAIRDLETAVELGSQPAKELLKRLGR